MFLIRQASAPYIREAGGRWRPDPGETALRTRVSGGVAIVSCLRVSFRGEMVYLYDV